MKRVAHALLFFLAGLLFPVLIWVAFGVVVNQWIRQGALQRAPARTVGELLSAAGLTVQWEVSATESLATAMFVKQPMSEIRELLARAGL